MGGLTLNPPLRTPLHTSVRLTAFQDTQAYSGEFIERWYQGCNGTPAVILFLHTISKEVKPEVNDYLQKTHHNRTKADELQRPCFKQDTKANQRWFKAKNIRVTEMVAHCFPLLKNTVTNETENSVKSSSKEYCVRFSISPCHIFWNKPRFFKLSNPQCTM